MKAIKKPITVNCWLITQEKLDKIFNSREKRIGAFRGKLYGADCWFYRGLKDDYNKRAGWGNVICKIKTLEGDMILRAGDYLIKGVKGEFYPCKAEIFKKTYIIQQKNKRKNKGRKIKLKNNKK